VTAIEISDKTTPGELDMVKLLARRADAVVAGVFVRIASYSGRMDLAPQAVSLLEAVAADQKRPFVAVIFGNPYTAMALGKLPAELLTYEFTDAMETAAVRALAGEVAIGGKLPITLPDMYPFGHGLTRAAANPAAVAPAPPDAGTVPVKGEGVAPPEAVRVPARRMVNPLPIREVRGEYTPEAKRAKIAGKVVLECVVLPDGSVGEVRVVESLDKIHGLDEQAIKAARQWRFTPGTRDGKPVPVSVTIELVFTLR
jgi:TonB family protein